MAKWAKGITAVRHADLGPSPAAINRETGVMYVNPNFRNHAGRKLTRDQWEWIILHEAGHLMAQTKDEHTADAWADRHYKGSLKQSVYALSDVLPFNKPEDRSRVVAQLRRAMQKDGKEYRHYAFTGNDKPMCSKKSNFYDPDYNSYFNGAGLLNWVNTGASIAKTVADTKNAFSKPSSPSGATLHPPASSNSNGAIEALMLSQELSRKAAEKKQAEQDAKDKKTMMYVGIGAAVLIVSVVLILIFKKK